MKVAVTAVEASLDSEVDPRFGRCKYIILVDLTTMEFEAVDNSAGMGAGGAGIATGQLVASKGAQAVLTGNCGPNAYQVLLSAGVQVFTGVTGKVRDAVQSFKSGQYKASAQPNVAPHAGQS